jgi:peptidoglycan LD-endopeptidase CwlK
MSGTLSPEQILFTQRLLSCCGLYDRKLDSQWGPRTDEGVHKFDARCEEIAAQNPRFDAGTERRIRTLDLRAQPIARRSLAAIRNAGIDARIISGTRSYPEQTALYRQGRFGNSGRVVTNAKAGQSWHNFGLAWDIGIFKDGAYLGESSDYSRAGPIGKTAGAEWGGDWHSFKDKPHYQVPFGATTVSAARERFESGGRHA